MIDARYWLSRPFTQAQRDWCRRHEPDLTMTFFAVVVVVLLSLALGACAGSTYPAGTSASTYQNATIQRCAYRPTEATVQALLAKNELFRDPATMSAAICSQEGRL